MDRGRAAALCKALLVLGGQGSEQMALFCGNRTEMSSVAPHKEKLPTHSSLLDKLDPWEVPSGCIARGGGGGYA